MRLLEHFLIKKHFAEEFDVDSLRVPPWAQTKNSFFYFPKYWNTISQEKSML